ncbi:hypothetical protein RDI58_017909 [Solanum bulbocastanum]|uniref:Uncharacterized protein n=1 Tax=Solanum bulbocastanum TaxID=147425 RepID=A0AAN8TAN1_SOLBU
MIDIASILELARLNRLKKKKSRRPIDPRDIVRSISSAPERISHELIYLLFRLVRRILDNIILITVDLSVLHLVHRHCLHDATRTYLYRLFVEHDPYRRVLHLP